MTFEEFKELKAGDRIIALEDTYFKTKGVYGTVVKKLREEELTKSALDNISGIGTVKKVELLKKFGSVQKIKEAQVEEIAKVKGIGLELARKIKEEL